jgi:hypothetical protein
MKNETHFPIVGFLPKQTLGDFNQIGMSFILASLLIVLEHNISNMGTKDYHNQVFPMCTRTR